MVAVSYPAGFLLAGAFAERLNQALFDDTFAGIYRLNWFDLSLLIPYFVVLGVLGVYGLHRYLVVWRYLWHRTKPSPEPSRRLDKLPRVTIQLPIYNERFVVDRLLEAVTAIRYPRELLQIQVLDDSTDETYPHAQRLVGELSAQGIPIEYRHRSHRHGYKAGALAEGLRSATGELIAMFDADFVPPPDFLERTVHHFTDPEVGLVQSRWTYLNREYSLLTEVQAIILDGHFALEHTSRHRAGLFFNFNGTAGVMRREMIDDAGGWQHDTLTEDSDLSYRAQLKGWRFIYLPDLECPSELPVETYSFQVQQSRWAKGLTQVALKLLPTIFRAKIPLRQKVEAFFHLTPNISYPLMIVISALMLPVMIVRFYMGWFQMLTLDLPFILATFFSIVAFYLVAQRELHGRRWRSSILMMPSLFAAGIALTIINSRVVLEALLRVPTGFVRTAKYAIAGKRRAGLARNGYRSPSGLLPWIELVAGSYFALMIAFSLDSFNFLAIPFLLLFVGGYYWAGFTTIWQEYQGRLRFERERQREAERAVSGS